MPGMPPKGGGILVRCLHHLIWLLMMQRSSSSTPRSFQISELLTLSLRMQGGTLKKNSSWHLQNLLLVNTQSCRWGMKLRLAGNLKASPSGSAQSSPQQSGKAAKWNCQSISCFISLWLTNKILKYLNYFEGVTFCKSSLNPHQWSQTILPCSDGYHSLSCAWTTEWEPGGSRKSLCPAAVCQEVIKARKLPIKPQLDVSTFRSNKRDTTCKLVSCGDAVFGESKAILFPLLPVFMLS